MIPQNKIDGFYAMKNLWKIYSEELKDQGLDSYDDTLIWENVLKDFEFFRKITNDTLHYHG